MDAAALRRGYQVTVTCDVCGKVAPCERSEQGFMVVWHTPTGWDLTFDVTRFDDHKGLLTCGPKCRKAQK